MRKRIFFAALALVLLILPLAVRWFYFYEGRYEPGKVTRPDLTGIQTLDPETVPFVDSLPSWSPGIILVDLAHGNYLEMAELSVLRARLSARGQQIELVETSDDLSRQLRYARALVIVSPGEDWKPDEIEQVEDFVDRGGRLLLVTDPTRFDILFDEWGEFIGLDYDVIHINDLAARFGLIFQADYLYNTAENEGNFRNIRLTDFDTHELTEGLEQVVFYAAHSIVSEQPVLIAAGGETRSSGSERAGELAVTVLAADGDVLALGDLTFMAEPYNAVYDNDRLVANIADFLSGAQRQYALADFPFFFDDQVDLVYAGDPLLDSDLLTSSGDLQILFAQEDKELIIREEEDRGHDTLFLGLYEEAEEIEPYLAAAQVTLLITPTETLDREVEVGLPPTPRPTATPSSAVTLPLTTTPVVTPVLELTITPDIGASPEVTLTAEISPSTKNRVAIESLGEMVLTGTLLLVLQTHGERQVLMVLADTEVGLESAIELLTTGDLDGCLLRETETPTPTILALCPSGEVAPGSGEGGWQGPGPQPPPPTLTPTPAVTDTGAIVTGTVEPVEPAGEPEGSILVVALDDGEGRYDSMTSAEQYAAILEKRFEVTVWSKAKDGSPSAEDLLDEDLVIWTSGDFEDTFGDEESELLFLLMLEEMPAIVSGAYVGDTDTEAVQRDIQVAQIDHPVVKGFEAGEVIGFVTAPSGSEYEIMVLEDGEADEGTVFPFVRGPNSEEAGAPAMMVIEDEFSAMRFALIGFPLYLLPEEVQIRLILNLVDWILSP